MNKQQLASQIWESANKMRSKIDASEYKNYILGFIFYKFLSEKELAGLLKEGFIKEELKYILNEDNEDLVKFCQNSFGYFIEYNNLFSTWLELGHDFDSSNITDALSSFTRLINKDYIKVFDKIFLPLETGLSKLGDTSGARTKAIRSIIELIKDIPMDDKQGYDVLGFIYEYLLSNFAANAGKKAGEFYTPHEVSILMSEIVADHLVDRDTISIYDPTSGSGSLLINIGKSVAKNLGNKDKIKYFAQELKEDTYALTRMNLVMRGIRPENIVTRNGDTLVDDWPYFEEGFKESTYEVLLVDAVVSNPPYSLPWEPKDDARFANYGLAPKSKADYAFLLHDLYHLKSDGIMTIVLPHGVLFRGGTEGEIRAQLVENDNIDTIIGLPANIFYGTGIPTIIMVLKKNRDDSDVLFIDASKCFEKVGKNNKLRPRDIKKILDAIKNRKTIPNFATLVKKEEIKANDYNLNIPRYVNSSEKEEAFDLFSLINGGIHVSELERFNNFFNQFPTLKKELFTFNGDEVTFNTSDISAVINNNNEIIRYKKDYFNKISKFESLLKNELVDKVKTKNYLEEQDLVTSLFHLLSEDILIDKYDAYEILDQNWSIISADLEIINTEGYNSIKVVDPKMVQKKKEDKIIEIQDGWEGRIIPFTLIQKAYFSDTLETINKKESRVSEITSYRNETIESFTEEEKNEYSQYFKEDQLDFVKIEKFAKKHTLASFEEDSLEYKMIKLVNDKSEEKSINAELKEAKALLISKTKDYIEKLNDEESQKCLEMKWVNSTISSLNQLIYKVFQNLCSSLIKLQKKYSQTLKKIDSEIRNIEKELTNMITELSGDVRDIKALNDLFILFGGEKNE